MQKSDFLRLTAMMIPRYSTAELVQDFKTDMHKNDSLVFCGNSPNECNKTLQTNANRLNTS
jgi:fructose-1-phosphate kinase PfkB-like protein